MDKSTKRLKQIVVLCVIITLVFMFACAMFYGTSAY